MVRLVDGRHVIGHATDRYVILMLGNYVIGMIVELTVIRVICLRLNRLSNLGHVILVMIDPLQMWFLIDLQNKQSIHTLIVERFDIFELLIILRKTQSLVITRL